jgi:6-phosphogluconolactonase
MHRRDLLKTLAIMSTTTVNAQNHKPLLYVGTYSNPAGPEGSHGNGEGIYLFEMDPATGALTRRDLFKTDSNPSWLAFDPAGNHLYSANETDRGTVSAYAVDRSSGKLTLLNTVSSEGDGPTHLDVHPGGKHVFVANYFSGTSTVLPILDGGKLGKATDVQHHQGKVGPVHAASGPPGSFSISGHEKPHSHMIHTDPSGNFVLAADLGLDLIFIWKYDPQHGKLIPHSQVSVPPGDGPRHFVFHPNKRWMDSIQEEASTLVAYDYDAAAGHLTPKQTLSTLPKGYGGTNFTSEIRISADGKFVYAGNRLHDTIAWFEINSSGALTFAGEEWTRGDYPRSFTIDPTGAFLYCCNQRSDHITAYRINQQTGALSFTGHFTPVGTPSVIVFL